MIRLRTLSLTVASSLAVAFGFATSISAQSPAPTSPFERLRFRNIGPATMGGRIDDFAVLESNPAVFYVAAATGGLWKTMNNGTTWEQVFANQDVVSIGDVAIAPNDANLVWVGTGENNNRQSSSWGGGVYKSTDGGHTWRMMGLEQAQHIARIIVDPADHNTVYVAALGKLWGPNPERGIYKTTDGGVTWTPVLQVDENTGGTELVMDPSNHNTLYAATYQRRRTAWGFNGGGPGSAIWKTTDAGKTWNKLTTGIPSGPLGRIGLDIYRKDPRILYARIEATGDGTGLYRSDDAGMSWRKMSDTNPRPMYFSQVRIDPNDVSRIYVLGVELHMSDDSGKTFIGNTVPHSDHHALWIDPNNSNHVITGCDGGVNVSYDRGAKWDFVDNIDIGQFYHVGYDMDTPYRVYGGLQDNASWYGPSALRQDYGIGNFNWMNIGSGDGFVTLADPTDSRVLYSESQGGNMMRVDRISQERKNIKPLQQKGEPPLRWNWDTPIQVSPHSPNTVFAAANKVFKSVDRGDTWTAISPDLTAQIDRDTLQIMGVAGRDIRVARNDGVSSYGVLVTFAESPMKAGLMYTGADDGTVYVSRDGGAHWTNLTKNFPGLPSLSAVSRVQPSSHNEGTVYVTFDNHRQDDFKPYVYVSTDYGASFRAITTGIPDGQAVRTITEDPKNAGVLYVGTEFGLFVSLDRGAHWMRVKANLPTVPINEITFHPRDNDMILATHGRSVWILDDATPFQQAPAAMATAAYLFDIRGVASYNPGSFRPDFGSPGDRRFWGKNPEPGAALAYYLRAPARSVTAHIVDASGSTIRDLPAEDFKDELAAGVHRVQWDLRHQPLPDSLKPTGGRGGGQGAGIGPFVMPGQYRVTVMVDGTSAGTKTVSIAGDPLTRITEVDRKYWHDVSLAVQQLEGIAVQAAHRIGALSAQVRAVGNQGAAATLDRRLATLRRQFGVPTPGEPPQTGRGGGGGGFGGAQPVPNAFAGVLSQLLDATSRPTEVQLRTAREARDNLSAAIQEINAIIGTDLPALYRGAGRAMSQPAVTPMPALAVRLP